MAGSIILELTGPKIEVRYRDGDLSVKEEDRDWGHFTHDQLTMDRTGIGRMITAVLLPSSRNGTKFIFTLLLPHMDVADDMIGSAVTGAALITRDFQHLVGGTPAILQEYDVRPLTGFVRDS